MLKNVKLRKILSLFITKGGENHASFKSKTNLRLSCQKNI